MGFTKNEILGIGSTSQRVRDQLVAKLKEQGVSHPDVLAVMAKMPRHLFVDEALRKNAYKNDALPIGHGQTISHPFIVARMTEELLRDGVPKKVLEVGTGSGYQAAVLAALVGEVYSVERIMDLHVKTTQLLNKMKFKNIHTKHSDGSWGWPENAPYDAIMVTAAPDDIPPQLLVQLRIGGKLVIPIGGQGEHDKQRLTVVRRVSEEKFETQALEAVRFVPFLGGAL